MHVISASRRTDIPAFHAQWFMNRVRSGAVGVRAPFGRGMTEVSLACEDVTAIVFWTKNAFPILEHLEELSDRGYPVTFLYTVNNYPESVEPHVPPLRHTAAVLESLHRKVPESAVRWRYDTIVLTDFFDRKWHVENFRLLCQVMGSYTDHCIFSFCDYYRKTIRNMERCVPGYVVPDEEQSRGLAEQLAEVAGSHGITLASCAHDSLLSAGIRKARCIDPEWLGRVVDSPERRQAAQALKTAPTRKDCGCAASRDIGAYDTCPHGCVYCYANANPERARRNAAGISVDAHCLDPRNRSAGEPW